MAWHKTGVAYDAFPAGAMREVNLGGTPVLLVRLASDVRATDAICTHEGGILAEGRLSGDKIVCPEHSATFDALTGRVVADPDGEPPSGKIQPLSVYPVRISDGMVEVDLGA
jgi:nitrite reductase/ring-hydroxylating ferredoxin subunit